VDQIIVEATCGEGKTWRLTALAFDDRVGMDGITSATVIELGGILIR
jgi:hypothetical protein